MESHASLAPVQDKVHVILASLPPYGHVRQLRALAKDLIALGYPVTFLAGSYNKQSIEEIKGINFMSLHGKADFDPENLDASFPGRPKENTVIFDMENIFFGQLDELFASVKEALSAAQSKDRRVVLIQDGCFVGTIPMLLGSPQIDRVPVIGFGHFPMMVLSEDTAPFGSGLPSQGREQNLAMNAGVIQMFGSVHKLLRELLVPYNCTKPLKSEFPVDNFFLLPDLYMQMCPAEMEPHRSDLPSHVRFCGTLTGGNDKTPRPEWWDEFVAAEDERPLVIVTSGSVPGLNVNDLIVPTIEAGKNLPIRLVVCAIHIQQPSDLHLPSNARWAQWIAFEDIFPYTSLIVSSGGYGGISQAFAAGIPMIVAGTNEDKAETGMRAEATGAAINLKTQTPSVEQLNNALKTMLKETTYKEKALRMKKAYADCDALGSIVNAIEELAEKFYHEDGRKKDGALATPAATAGASPAAA